MKFTCGSQNTHALVDRNTHAACAHQFLELKNEQEKVLHAKRITGRQGARAGAGFLIQALYSLTFTD